MSIQKIDEEVSVANINGDYKTIIGNYEIINKTLVMAENSKIEDFIKSFSNCYSKDEIKSFISTLYDEKLLVGGETVIDKTNGKDAMILYCGKLYESLREPLTKVMNVLYEFPIKEYDCNKDYTCNVVIVVVSGSRWKEILELNKNLYSGKIPYLFCYYDGDSIVLGPLIIPWKTVCLECIATHHMKVLSSSTKKDISIRNFKELNFSYDIDAESFNNLEYYAIAHKIVATVNKLGIPGSVHNLIGTEYKYNPGQVDRCKTRKYTPISSCDCCHAFNKKYRNIKNISDLSGSVEEKCNNDDKKIKYFTAGLRSLSKNDTKKFLQNALFRAGLNIDIRINQNNPFSEIIPVYDSYLEEIHENPLGFVLEKQVSHGKGINREQAYFSAGFEIFERISSRYFGEKEIISAKPKDVEKIAIDLKTLTKNIHNTNTPLDVFDKEKYVDWVWGESIITGEKRLVPASMVFFSNVVFEGNFFPLSSSGLAAGGTLDDAILQGLFELIEHDAWIMGQSIPRKLPLLDFSSSANTKLLDKISLINEAGYEIVTRDYTNDIGIPVFRTWIVNSKNYNKYATNGFGASLDPEIALERSVTEAVQSANDEDLVDIEIYGKSNANYLSSDPSSVYNLNYFINKDIIKNRDEKVNKFEKYRIKNYGNVKEVLKATKSILQSKIKDLDLIYVNLTREKIGIPVVRVLAIGDLQTVGLPMLSVSPRTFNFGNIEKSHEESLRYEDLYMGIYPH